MLALAAVVFFSVALLAVVDFAAVDFSAASVAAAAGSAAAVAVASRDVLESAARALPAAVCSPLAFDALPAAMRALAALVDCALLVWRAALPVLMVASPPSAALILSISRLLRRAAALGWIAPALAALSNAETASMSAIWVCSASPEVAVTCAFLTSVLAAERRGWRMALRRAACRTRFRPWGERAPVQVRDE